MIFGAAIVFAGDLVAEVRMDWNKVGQKRGYIALHKGGFLSCGHCKAPVRMMTYGVLVSPIE
jgi:hypothetical protein